jgi:uncharacterized membrane protein YbhN (UPF0104 family)
MLKKVNFFKLSIYLSIPFLLWVLYKFDYLIIPRIVNLWSLLLSFLFLFAGFVLMCENWRIVLKHDGIVELTKKESIVSNGLSIFTKYIPGKVLTIFSRALYVQKRYEIPLKTLTFISLKTQLISLWFGLLIGSVIIFQVDLNTWIKLIAIAFLLTLFLFLFSNNFKKALIYLISKFFKKNVDYPILKIRDALKFFPSFLLNWLFWCFGFYFLCHSIVEYDVSISIGFSFALASVIAIFALVAPGGIGVREGILMSILIALGIEKQDAITISIVSRLWFLVGEVFIFLLASILNYKINKKSDPKL